MIRLSFLILLSAGPSALTPGTCETVDRVVASIGNAAITQSEVEAEYRLELFLNGKSPGTPSDVATFVLVRDRLIEQKLLREDAAEEETVINGSPDASTAGFEEVRKKFGSEEAFQFARRVLGMDEGQIRARMAAQEETLRMIEQRFRPAASPDQSEIETYYRDTFAREYTRRNEGPVPSLGEVESRIREILIEKNTNHLLDAWLEEMKSRRRVRIHAD